MAVNTALEKFTLSEYAKGLVEHPRRRYEEKLGLISFSDPFLLPSMGGASVAAPVSLPPVEASDIVAYLVLQTSVSSPLSSSRLTNLLMLTTSLSMVG